MTKKKRVTLEDVNYVSPGNQIKKARIDISETYCPECCISVIQDELNTFDGLCESCYEYSLHN